MKFSDYLAVSTIIQEASNQPDAGMLAVAEVLLRRTERKIMSDGTLSDTILRAYQFSGWNTADPNRIRAAKHVDAEDNLYQRALRAWTRAQEEKSDVSNGATHYYNPKAVTKKPLWAVGLSPCATIGDHLFFKGVR